MADPAQPYVLTRGSLPLSPSRVLVQGDVLTDQDLVLIGGVEEVERLALMGLLARQAIVVVSSPKASAKADKARIADLEGQLAALSSGADTSGLQASVDRLTAERNAAFAARDAALADDAADAAATAAAQARADAAEAALAAITAERDQAETARDAATTAAATALAERTDERDRAEADLAAKTRRVQVLESALAAVPDPAIAAAEISGLKTRIEALTGELAVSRAGAEDPARLDALTAERDEARAALAAAEAGLETARAALAAAPAAEVVTNLTAELETARAETELARAEILTLQDALATARADASEASRAGLAALDRVTALEAEVASLTEANVQLQADLAAALKAADYRGAPLEADQPANPAGPETPAAADPATGG